MKNSKICICIPLYNAENTINETVKSILNQSYKNFELIISDNHSTDKSISVIKKLNDERIKIVKTKSFYEIGEDNFNRCIKLSNAEFTAILHSDDIYHKDFLYHQLKNLNDNPKIAISFTEGQNVNSYGKFIKKIVSPFKSDNNNLYFENIYPLLLENYNFFITPTMVFRTDVFLKNSYKWNYKDFKSSSDLALWLEVSRKYQISIVKKI